MNTTFSLEKYFFAIAEVKIDLLLKVGYLPDTARIRYLFVKPLA